MKPKHVFVLVAGLCATPVMAQQQGQQPPDIIVQGESKPKLVCSSVIPTGSRIGRNKRCLTRDEAALETQLSREAARERAQLDRTLDAIDCARNPQRVCE